MTLDAKSARKAECGKSARHTRAFYGAAGARGARVVRHEKTQQTPGFVPHPSRFVPPSPASQDFWSRARGPDRSGDHEVWRSPISNRHFVVDRQMKSKHTANETLKQAGLEKAF